MTTSITARELSHWLRLPANRDREWTIDGDHVSAGELSFPITGRELGAWFARLGPTCLDIGVETADDGFTEVELSWSDGPHAGVPWVLIGDPA